MDEQIETGDALAADAVNGATVRPVVSGIPPAPAALPAPLHKRGRKVLLADEREWSVPPLLLEQVMGDGRALFLRILNASEGEHMFAGVGDAAVGLAHMALVRNYPTLTPEEVRPLLDMECIYELLEIMFNMNGFRELLSRLGVGLPTGMTTRPH